MRAKIEGSLRVQKPFWGGELEHGLGPTPVVEKQIPKFHHQMPQVFRSGNKVFLHQQGNGQIAKVFFQPFICDAVFYILIFHALPQPFISAYQVYL